MRIKYVCNDTGLCTFGEKDCCISCNMMAWCHEVCDGLEGAGIDAPCPFKVEVVNEYDKDAEELKEMLAISGRALACRFAHMIEDRACKELSRVVDGGYDHDKIAEELGACHALAEKVLRILAEE